MNVITNTQPRRLSMASFTGLFLLALAIPCIAFIQSAKFSSALPAKEMAELREKERIVKSFADLSDNLRTYQDAQSSNNPNATRLAADCKTMMMKLYSELSGKDTARIYKDIYRSLEMANQYFAFTQSTNLSKMDVNPLIVQLQSEKTQLQNDKTQLQNEIQLLNIKLVTKPPAAAGGGGGGAPQIVQVDKPCPPCPTNGTASAPVDCQSKISDYKKQINPSLRLMNGNINNIRNDLSRIKCFIGQNKDEKQNIDRNLKGLEDGIKEVLSQ